MHQRRLRIENLVAEPLSVLLIEPFVIATGRVDVTPSVLVRAVLRDTDTGAEAEGLGESATLPGVTRETQSDVLRAIRGAELRGTAFAGIDAIDGLLAGLQPVARAGVETALLDAWAGIEGVPLRDLLGSSAISEIVTDITIPIAIPEHMGELAADWWAKGFRHFKVKVGRGVEEDLAALEAIYQQAPEAQIRLDANAAYSATESISLAQEATALGARIECFEQPCGRLALDAMAEVTAALDVPVIADESVATLADLTRVIDAKAAHGVNLKLAKSGGPLTALAIGRAARAAGLSLMCGAMVETRLGIAAAANVAAALGGVEFPDLDTAFLLAEDPFTGGYSSDGPRLSLSDEPGLGVRLKSR